MPHAFLILSGKTARQDIGKGFPDEIGCFKALVTDDPSVKAEATQPVFALDDVDALADWIEETYIRG